MLCDWSVSKTRVPSFTGSAGTGALGSAMRWRRPQLTSPYQMSEPIRTMPPGEAGANSWPGGSPCPARCVATIWAWADDIKESAAHAAMAIADAVRCVSLTVLPPVGVLRVVRAVDAGVG